jgi:hypothetical protein
METSSAYSESYIAVEQRIRGGELSLSELEHLLEGLVSKEQITSAEQQVLLELAWGIHAHDMPASKDV